MTLLHIIVDVPDVVDPATSDPEQVAANYMQGGRRWIVSASWDMVQVPPVDEHDEQPLTVDAVLVLANYGDKAMGYVLPGFGVFRLAQHFRTVPAGTPPLRIAGPDQYDHATFSGKITGGYGFAVADDRADLVARLLQLADDELVTKDTGTDPSNKQSGCEACSFSPDGCSFCSGRSAIDVLRDRGGEGVIDAGPIMQGLTQQQAYVGAPDTGEVPVIECERPEHADGHHGPECHDLDAEAAQYENGAT